MKVVVTVVLVCLALALSVSAKEKPAASAYALCKAIGLGSGCSGCSANTVDCEWCASADNDVDAMCAPQGFCADLKDSNNNSMVSATELCPSQPRLEPIYRVTEASLSTYTEGGPAKARLIEGTFSPSFDSHYCNFPSEPWTVDRSANPIGGATAADNCNRVNLQLPAQRFALDICLRGKTVPGEPTYGPKDDPLTPKRKECLRVYQSYLCTLGCPKYGTAVDFKSLCAEDMHRIEQHCDIGMVECISELGGVDLRDVSGKAAANAEHCFHPELIPASGKFEYDLCFYGDPHRCKAADCRVIFETSTWPTWTYTNVGPDGNDLSLFSNGENFLSTQRGPACDIHGDVSDGDNGALWYGCTGFLLKIVEKPSGGGLSCETATANYVLKYAGHSFTEWYLEPWCYADHCIADAYLDEEQIPPSKFLNTKLSTADYKNCPKIFNYVWSL